MVAPTTMPRCPRCQSEYGEGVVYCALDGVPLLPMVLEGRYRLLSQLGEGGMGVVYLGEHLGLGKRVAVKVLRGELSRDETFRQRFEQEAVAASQIGHEHIVDVTDLGRAPSGELYYVMELLTGQSLGSLLRHEHRLPLGRAVHILAQVCRALEAAHSRGIIHRDVTPQNVMVLSREGRPDFVKVVDFGLSKLSGRQGKKLTETGAILGTADYVAPEQVKGDAVDTYTDVYALGVLTYELLTGTPPFQAENTFATMLLHLEAPVEPPSRRSPESGLPTAVDALVLQALAKEPHERPTMAHYRAELEALVPSAQKHASARARVTPSAPTPAPRPVHPRAPPKRGTAPKRWRWAATGGALAAVGVAMGWLAHRAPPPAAQVTAAAPHVEPPAPSPGPAPLRPEEQPRVLVVSNPPGAMVSVGGRVLGRTPLELDAVDGGGPWRFELDGHSPATVERLPPSGRLDVSLKKLPVAPASSPPASRMKRVRELKPNPFD
ncbi:protein kinase [Myxococcus sp. K15C18031901]|uniref:serine/threonine protein kinase n=1 Tax=Myxococcus dinghuensis TaxID=2906761 RepID=UPI0020A7347C|nr:serine/threonine-protein kinase [Myxococcus dinghuensis]MCP3098655.1 protein kinase [Myxococcus dinghuensis]